MADRRELEEGVAAEGEDEEVKDEDEELFIF